ncbi:MAG TPA: hypothetical protein VE931_09440, partial [Pyrinomonadaceae bacterium]|nr:hypothetical protein [Pyrinomonadaceae bacterium]
MSSEIGTVIAEHQAGGLINGRSIKRITGRRSGVEVWRWMHFHDFDLHYCVLGFGLRSLLRKALDRIYKIFQDLQIYL